MQVFGLRRQVYQAARLASRLAARPQDSEAARDRGCCRRTAGLDALSGGEEGLVVRRRRGRKRVNILDRIEPDIGSKALR